VTAPAGVRALVTDAALAARLESAEGRANVAFVEARARLAPETGATWREVGGTLAMFDGVGSPLTQTFGLGLAAPPTHEALADLEAFFHERGAEVLHEVSPLADASHLALLPARGYQPVELTAVLYQPLASAGDAPPGDAPAAGPLHVRRVPPGEEARWAATSAGGWGETPELSAFMEGFGLVSARSEGTACWLAEWEGTPVAAAAMSMHGGVALLAGASTVPAWRGRGAQAALLQARLRHAAASGCDVAMMGAQPGSASQRNAERQGFRIGYTRIKWQLRAAAR
jgi:GNAT superfamily N-acetyltransferase